MPKGILVSFLFPVLWVHVKECLECLFLLFIGVLLRHTSCLFCMVFAKMPLAWGILLPFFCCCCCNFGPQEVSSLPYPVVPSFLNSIFCMLHLEPAHRAISPMYNKRAVPVSHCSLFSALVGREGGTCFLSLLAGEGRRGQLLWLERQKGSVEATVGWAQMIEKTSGLALPLRASASNLDLHWALPASLSSPLRAEVPLVQWRARGAQNHLTHKHLPVYPSHKHFFFEFSD